MKLDMEMDKSYMVFGIVLLIAIFLLNVYIIADFVKRYRATSTETDMGGKPLSIWGRMVMASRGSATVLFIKFAAIFWSTILALAEFSDLIQMPEIHNFLEDALGPRATASINLLFIFVAYLARSRRLSDTPLDK